MFFEDSDYIHNHELKFFYLSYLSISSLISILCQVKVIFVCRGFLQYSKPESILTIYILSYWQFVLINVFFVCLGFRQYSKPEFINFFFLHIFLSLPIASLLLTFFLVNVLFVCLGFWLHSQPWVDIFLSILFVKFFMSSQSYLCLSRIPTVIEPRVYFSFFALSLFADSFSLIYSLSLSMFSLFV